MSLESLLNLSNEDFGANSAITEERILNNIDGMRNLISFYRAYPDIFIDDMTGFSKHNSETDGPWKGFQFYYYQRLFLRACMRHRKTYFTFSRGFSKSFLSMMSLMIKAVLYPNSELSITTGGKARIACAALS